MSVVEMKIDSLRQNSLSNEWALILKEKHSERYLPIYMGSSQGDIIKRELIPPDPEYFDLSLESIDIRFARLESVVINWFEDNVFHAKLLVTYRNNHQEVECPLPKAVAIGIRANAPIFADEQVLVKAAITVRA